MEQMKILGTVQLAVRTKNGVLKHQQKLKNLVTSVGLLQAAKRIGGVSADPILYIAIGDDATGPALAQTALQGTELDRVLAVAGASGAVLTLVATIGSGVAAPVTVRELGTFDAAAAGNMFSRITPIEFDMDTGDTLDVSWELTLS